MPLAAPAVLDRPRQKLVLWLLLPRVKVLAPRKTSPSPAREPIVSGSAPCPCDVDLAIGEEIDARRAAIGIRLKKIVAPSPPIVPPLIGKNALAPSECSKKFIVAPWAPGTGPPLTTKVAVPPSALSAIVMLLASAPSHRGPVHDDMTFSGRCAGIELDTAIDHAGLASATALDAGLPRTAAAAERIRRIDTITGSEDRIASSAMVEKSCKGVTVGSNRRIGGSCIIPKFKVTLTHAKFAGNEGSLTRAAEFSRKITVLPGV